MAIGKMTLMDGWVPIVDTRLQLPPRWSITSHYPGYGDLTALERECAQAIGVSAVDGDLGMEFLLYASPLDAARVAVEMTRRRGPPTLLLVSGDDGLALDPYVIVSDPTTKNGLTR